MKSMQAFYTALLCICVVVGLIYWSARAHENTARLNNFNISFAPSTPDKASTANVPLVVTLKEFQKFVAGSDKPIFVNFVTTHSKDGVLSSTIINQLATEFKDRVRFVQIGTIDDPQHKDLKVFLQDLLSRTYDNVCIPGSWPQHCLLKVTRETKVANLWPVMIWRNFMGPKKTATESINDLRVYIDVIISRPTYNNSKPKPIIDSRSNTATDPVSRQ